MNWRTRLGAFLVTLAVTQGAAADVIAETDTVIQMSARWRMLPLRRAILAHSDVPPPPAKRWVRPVAVSALRSTRARAVSSRR